LKRDAANEHKYWNHIGKFAQSFCISRDKSQTINWVFLKWDERVFEGRRIILGLVSQMDRFSIKSLKIC
jgi:hypothetical protein